MSVAGNQHCLKLRKRPFLGQKNKFIPFIHKNLRSTSDMNLKKSAISTAIGLAIAGSAATPLTAFATVQNFTFNGWFTMLDPDGNPLENTSILRGNAYQTALTGSMSFDTVTGAGTADIDPFEFNSKGNASAQGVQFQAIGDGMGDPNGTLVLGNMTFDWNNNVGIPISVVLDAAGFFTQGATMATPASDGSYIGGGFANNGYLSLGPVLMATTTWNVHPAPDCGLAANSTPPSGGGCMTVLPSGGLPLVADTHVNLNKAFPQTTGVYGIGGVPMWDGPFEGFNGNFDVTSLTFVNTGGTVNGGNPFPVGPYPSNAVPVPAAVWLFGSGLVGLVGVARRNSKKA
jgi:hypothetical protein